MRAKKMTMVQPGSQKLKWLETQDTADRGMWVESYRNGSDTLGVVIQNTMYHRDAHWSSQAVAPIAQAQPSHQSPSNVTAADAQEITISGKQCYLSMKDTTTICKNFNAGKCKGGDNCPNGQHRCAVAKGRGRVCGAPHAAYSHQGKGY